MGHLSAKLQQFTQRQHGQLMFAGRKNLQELALNMWQELHFSKIDASVLSRVLHGKRLFTPEELAVFCRIMQLSSEEVEHLFHCLALDYFEKDHIHIDRCFIPTSSIVHLIAGQIELASKTGEKELVVDQLYAMLLEMERYNS